MGRAPLFRKVVNGLKAYLLEATKRPKTQHDAYDVLRNERHKMAIKPFSKKTDYLTVFYHIYPLGKK